MKNNIDDYTLLEYCIYSNIYNIDIIKLLLTNKSINLTDYENNNSLMIYLRKDINHNIEVVKLLFSNKAIEQLNKYKENALMIYCDYQKKTYS